ncbi:AMP-binding protein [Limnobacter humi]|uniref:AMP-binding protein n=1 Tax=Limnobacter humi TaxID=1778671 RepID=A0ABT1WBS1_9BURK|nr:AMP-binding protein [Limnobacter humi]MCQ8894961.1 AMP-binding protein [Limnobacter humi]
MSPAAPQYSNADLPQFETLLDCLQHWSTTCADEVHFVQPMGPGEVVEYTWAQVNDQVQRMAAYLQSLNLPPRSNIAILGKNSAHWIMADLAIWMAGHISVPIYPTVNAETAAYVLAHSEAKLLFLGKMEELWPVVKEGIPEGLPTVVLPLGPSKSGSQGWNQLLSEFAPTQQPAQRTADELATLMYTSGSTGNPKGVMVRFGAMTRALLGTAQLYGIHRGDRMLSYLPLAHAAERAVVETGSMVFGFRVYFSLGLSTFIEDLRRARPTLFFSVPRLWAKFYNGICAKISPRVQSVLFRIPVLSGLFKRKILQQLGLSEVRMALSGSAPLSAKLIEWYRGLGLELLEGYAMTENFAYSHGNRLDSARPGYVGLPFPGVDCRISEQGEIQVKGPTLMMGYYKLPELTEEAFTEDGYLKTGDMGEVDELGRLKITGRVKELFKTSKGKYVAPVPIENRLMGHALIEAVCVTGPSLPQPIALVMLPLEEHQAVEHNPEERAHVLSQMTELLNAVNAKLEAHEQLDCLIVVKDLWTMENGFLTPTMKIRRNIIEAHYLPKVEAWLKTRQPVVIEP